MSDGPLAQQQLCSDLASLIHPLPGSSAAPTTSPSQTISKANILPFLDAFWQTMAREWNGIDRLRMDKYMLLVRLVLRATFAMLIARRRVEAHREDIDLDLFEAHMALISRWPLSAVERVDVGADEGGPETVPVPRGLTYHVLDCWVDEIERAAGGAEACAALDADDMDVAVIPLLVATVNGLEERVREKAVRARALEVLQDERLVALLGEWPGSESEEESEDEDEWDGMEE